jgi:hypothetical protein
MYAVGLKQRTRVRVDRNLVIDDESVVGSRTGFFYTQAPPALFVWPAHRQRHVIHLYRDF